MDPKPEREMVAALDARLASLQAIFQKQMENCEQKKKIAFELREIDSELRKKTVELKQRLKEAQLEKIKLQNISNNCISNNKIFFAANEHLNQVDVKILDNSTVATIEEQLLKKKLVEFDNTLNADSQKFKCENVAARVVVLKQLIEEKNAEIEEHRQSLERQSMESDLCVEVNALENLICEKRQEKEQNLILLEKGKEKLIAIAENTKQLKDELQIIDAELDKINPDP